MKKTLGILKPYKTIGRREWQNMAHAMRRPLSGYLGGKDSRGYWVSKLEADFADRVGANHAIACNSATSGLLAACLAIGLAPGDEVWTTPYTMSATAAPASMLGAKIRFIDIEDRYFSLNPNNFTGKPTAIIVTNLFGHPAYLAALRSWCDAQGVWMIEDNAQSPLAMENGKYAGTIGHLGVFSFNVHKHIQAGEGGIVCTDNAALAEKVFGSVNHGELSGGRPGLNLRMTETTAAICCAQLSRADELIKGRIDLAHAISDIFADIPFVRIPLERADCIHVYYLWAGLVTNGKRKKLIDDLKYLGGIPIRAGYSPLLTTIFDPSQSCPTAERVEKEIIVFEVCAYDPTPRQLAAMREIVYEAADGL